MSWGKSRTNRSGPLWRLRTFRYCPTSWLRAASKRSIKWVLQECVVDIKTITPEVLNRQYQLLRIEGTTWVLYSTFKNAGEEALKFKDRLVTCVPSYPPALGEKDLVFPLRRRRPSPEHREFETQTDRGKRSHPHVGDPGSRQPRQLPHSTVIRAKLIDKANELNQGHDERFIMPSEDCLAPSVGRLVRFSILTSFGLYLDSGLTKRGANDKNYRIMRRRKRS